VDNLPPHLLAGIEVDGGRGLRRQAQDGGGAVVGAERPEPKGPDREAPVLRTTHRQWVKHTDSLVCKDEGSGYTPLKKCPLQK